MPPTFDPEARCKIPQPGDWPLDPQEDQPLDPNRLWIDGCFDFFHHGHTGVMLQSRRLGKELYVGLHNDEDIAANKGPTVMSLDERVAAVNSCRFSTRCVPHTPYITSIPWIDHYGCGFVVHGDDITSDVNGEDCYRLVKKAGRMKIVPRTPGISTTDLVGRMLLCTKEHFIRDLVGVLDGKEGKGNEEERKQRGSEMKKRIQEYASAEDGKGEWVSVYGFQPKHRPSEKRKSTRRRSSVMSNSSENSSQSPKREHHHHDPGKGTFTPLVSGLPPQPDQRLVYVDGGFDLFSSGHIAFLESVTALERQLGEQRGWYNPSAREKRIATTGHDYPPAYVIAGVHDDEVINFYRGVNYPIMNIFERGLCVVQCRYVHCVVFSAPFTQTKHFLSHLPACETLASAAHAYTTTTTNGPAPSSSSTPSHPTRRVPDIVYHGPTTFLPSPHDPLTDAKNLGIFHEVLAHRFQDVNAAQIVQRILDKRTEYEERQKKKGEKSVGEEAMVRREELEREREGELQRKVKEGQKGKGGEKELELRRAESWKEVERQFGA